MITNTIVYYESVIWVELPAILVESVLMIYRHPLQLAVSIYRHTNAVYLFVDKFYRAKYLIFIS